ncbi:hypothetical protein JHK86_010401 [Glycine max]|nr:hypothetical protein JHK86_010401 [Glycine max]
MSIGATGGIIFDQAGKELSQTEISDIGTKCIGALDGTHIPVTVSPDERPIYRNRKDRVTGHGAETAMDADEATSRKTNEVKFMGHTFSSEKDWRKEKE